jgi:DNA recombination protein RmuC
MTPVWIGLLLVAALLIWLLAKSSQGQQRNQLLESQMTDLRRDLQTLVSAQAQNAGQVSALAQSVGQRLENVSKALQDGVTSSAQIASTSQSAMAAELKNTRDQIAAIQKQLGEVQQAGREMSSATQTIQSILGGANPLGSLGEVTLERLLEDSLPKSQFARQYRFATGEAVDAVIFLRDGKLMSIDSKFPLEAYRRIASDGDDARRAFATAVKNHAESLARKYILPQEGTLDIALMFVPSESVYYELLMTSDSKAVPLDSYCREIKVIPVSPNTLYAHLCVIAMGLRGLQIEENARRLNAGISGVQKQLDVFGETFEKLGTHIKNVQQCYLEADKRLEKAHLAVDTLLGAALPEAPVETPRQATLALSDLNK